MSVDIDVDVEIERNVASAIVTKRQLVEIDELFTDGELRLWQDRAGWNGYVREVIDNEVRFYEVNTRFDDDSWISKVQCEEQAVHDAIQNHIEDQHAGGAGNFVRRCSPP